MNAQFGRREILEAGDTATVASTAGCTSLFGGGKSEVAIGGKQFTEQVILSNVSSILLEDAGYRTNERYTVGGGVANYEAVTSGRTEHYWEYTGTAWNHLLDHEDGTIRDPEELHRTVNESFQQEHDVTWLQRAEFNNTYVVTANPEW
jgi:osmoprotectant transport system substrate-binding protein